jgi:c-di-GMP-binding flagellar brake protein YcgR
MKKNKILNINTKIELTSQDNNTIYKSIIQEVKGDTFAIALPVYKRIPLHLHNNDVVNIKIFTDSACYSFSTKVLGAKKEDGLILYVLKKPKKVKKTERRGYVRVKAAVLVEYEEIDRENINDYKKVVPHKKAYTLDISGGGIQIVLPETILMETFLVINLPLDFDGRDTVLKVLGQVVRLEKEKIKNKLCYKIGIRFVEIMERERDLIIQYIFKLMRKNLNIRRGDS